MKFSTRDLCFCAIGAALIAVCAWISIPADVPFTLQTFAIFAVCGLLGGKPDYVICYKDIKQIGPDIIIVDICL